MIIQPQVAYYVLMYLNYILTTIISLWVPMFVPLQRAQNMIY